MMHCEWADDPTLYCPTVGRAAGSEAPQEAKEAIEESD
jgi:hypothetical protein